MIFISSVSNDKVKRVAALASDADERRNSGLFVVHGIKLALDAFAFGFEPESLFVTEKALANYSDKLSELIQTVPECCIIGENVEKKLTDQRSPQGVVAVFKKGRAREMTSDRVAVLCSVQDPVNVGTASRSALAFGFDLMLTSGCADLLSPKTLRASMGASMKVAFDTAADGFEALEKLKSRGFVSYATSLYADPVPLDSVTPASKSAVFVGSEGRGLDDDLCRSCDRTVIIPMSGSVESLNAAAAAAIMFWHFRKAE